MCFLYKKFLWQKILGCFFLLLIGGCTLKTIPPTIRIKPRLDLGENGTRHSARFNNSTKLPLLAVDFDCFFASVDDVGPTFSASGVTAAQLACMGMNNVSTLAFQSAASSGLDLSVTTGTNRTIRFFGVQTALGVSCSGKNLKELFTQTSAPAIYEVGSVTQDIQIGGGITVPNTFGTDQPNYKDLYSLCTDRLALIPIAVYKGGLDASIDTQNVDASLPPPGFAGAYTLVSTILTPPVFSLSTGSSGTAGGSVHLLFKIPSYGSAITEYRKLTIRVEGDSGGACADTTQGTSNFKLAVNKMGGGQFTFGTHLSQGGVVSFESPAANATRLSDYFPTQTDSTNGISTGNYLNIAVIGDPVADESLACSFVRLNKVFATLSK